MTDPESIYAVAQREVSEELFRAKVDAQKARIYEGLNRSLWSRFLAWLPFTITWKT